MSAPIRPTNSPECRYIDNVLHQCRRRDGRLIGPDEPCYFEALAQIRDQAQEQTSA